MGIHGRKCKAGRDLLSGRPCPPPVGQTLTSLLECNNICMKGLRQNCCLTRLRTVRTRIKYLMNLTVLTSRAAPLKGKYIMTVGETACIKASDSSRHDRSIKTCRIPFTEY
ncbi:hypothetical protein AVEN_254236-1 [Araneus ventricosus]|uniref:Uncharacterized protein n=1 Tax=Araneus ventricosus TaxID=182803 RepID=A0A4Y2SAG6_ARAVE|nr:hypothetical protein AVEN_254236-1 [Araneus ventricosus]